MNSFRGWLGTGLGSCIALYAAVMPTVARAAVSATVSLDGAKVHEQPKESSPVIDTLPIGTMLRLGNKSQGGWRRAAIPIGDHRGKIGWIQEDAVNILDVATTQGLDEAARAPKKKIPATLRLMGGASMSFGSDSTSGALVTQLSYSAQGSYLVTPHFSFGLRGTVTPITFPTLNTGTGLLENTTEYGIGFMVPFEYAFLTGETLHLAVGAGPSVGLPIGNGGSLTFGGAGYVGASVYLGDSFFVRVDGGFALAISKDPVTGSSTTAGNPFGFGVLGVDF